MYPGVIKKKKIIISSFKIVFPAKTFNYFLLMMNNFKSFSQGNDEPIKNLLQRLFCKGNFV